MTNKNNALHVTFDNELVLVFDRDQPLPAKQTEYLQNMEARMQAGIPLGDDFIAPPNPLQKAQFVANSMVHALLKQDNPLAIAMCTYLGTRLPELKQVKCIGSDERNEKNGIKIEFVYDEHYDSSQQEQAIQFFDPKDFMQ